MADDPYKTLGVPKTATADEIRTAYRKLAKKHHPDLNPGNKTAEETFKTLNAANDILADPEKRARFDAGEIDATGAERAPPRGYRDYAEAPQGARYAYSSAQGGPEENYEDIFANLFGDRAQRQTGPAKGRDASYSLTADFLDAINGATKRLTLPDGQTLDVKIPPGTADGDILRLRNRGAPGRNGGPAGDALIEISIRPHDIFTRDGQDISLTLPISLREAILGAKISAPTPAGPVALTIKPGADTGTKMRLKGRGVPAHGTKPAGDLYITLTVQLGFPDEALATFLRDNPTAATFDPRGTTP